MNHLKISDSFKEIISIGLLSRQKKFGRSDLAAWEHKFDISSWEEWEVSSLVSKNEIIELGKVQEVTLRAVFKKNNELGHTALVATIITFNRNLPEHVEAENLDEESVIPDCFWYPVQVRYYESPASLSQVVCLDPLQC